MPRLPSDVVELLEHAARHPEGGAALLEGNLESVAALYQLHPARVEHVRVAVAHPEQRSLAEAILAAAEDPPNLPKAQPRQPPADAHALIAEASLTPDGLEFLTHAPIENAALLFGSHPFVVEQARAQLSGGAEE